MDPVSHLLFGRTVALTIHRRSALTGVTAALVLGSILPDADAALMPRGFDLTCVRTRSLPPFLGGA